MTDTSVDYSKRGVYGAPTRADVVIDARTWIGTPYGHQGRTKGVLVDCAGVPIGVCRALGNVAPDFDVNGYARIPDGVSLIAECDKWMTRISMSDMRPGDALVFSFLDDPSPTHLGIVVDYRYGGSGLAVVHAYNKSNGRGHVEERRLERTRVMKPVQAYALPGVV